MKLAVVVGAILLPVTASAGPAILLESYAGARPDQAVPYVRQLLASMGEAAPLHGPRLRQQIDSRLARGTGSGAEAARLRATVEEGGRLFIEGEFPTAIARLESARAGLLREVGGLAADPSLRSSLHRALLFLAHAYLRSQQPEKAAERIGEVVRSFPDRDLSLLQVQHGPDLVTLYRKVQAVMGRQGRGSLVVTTQPPGCQVYVDERLVGTSPTRVADLFPGRYRVLAQRGRVHEVVVHQGEQSLHIQLELEAALRTDAYVGLGFPDTAALERLEVSLAATVGQALDASSVLLVGFRQHEGRKALVGSAISPVTGRLRSAIVVVEPTPPSPAALRALGRFLLDGQGVADAGLIIPRPGLDAPAAAQRTPFFSARVFRWVTLGVAAGALAAGVALLAVHGRGTCDGSARCPEKLDTLAAGAALTGVGGAAAIGSGILFYWDRRQRSTERSTSAALVPWLGAVGASALLSF
jgi:hypothetical protein